MDIKQNRDRNNNMDDCLSLSGLTPVDTQLSNQQAGSGERMEFVIMGFLSLLFFMSLKDSEAMGGA